MAFHACSVLNRSSVFFMFHGFIFWRQSYEEKRKDSDVFGFSASMYAHILPCQSGLSKNIYLSFYLRKKRRKEKKKNTKPYRLRALPCVEVGATVICEQVPNGRNTNSNCTACQPILWKKLSLQLRKNRFAMEKPSGWD